MADFVAHNDERDSGVATESLEAFYLSIKYFLEYVSPKKTLDIGTPFPLYVKKLMKYQIDKCKETELKENFNVNKARLKSRIDTIFSEDRKNEIAIMRKTKISADTFNTLQYILGFIGSHPAFDQDRVISELLEVIKANKLNVNEVEVLKHSGRIAACVMLLLHETTFEYRAHKKGYCKVSCDKTSIPYNQIFVDKDGSPVDHKESFGNLQVLGHVILEKDGKDLIVCYPLVIANLSVEDWCNDDMFIIEPITKDHPHYLHRKIAFDQALCFTDNGKIGVFHA
ncbi:hypothetical protein PCO87_18915 [Pectobacteriaceae bacterium C52]|nr:hypothetical protein PCO87_18915 [Pectobacteriaceae bacterium C52]